MNFKRIRNAAGRQSSRLQTASKDNSQETQTSFVWSGRARLIASLLICLHLLAVVAEPLRFFSRSPENFAAADTAFLRRTLGPYVDAMYLSHGYFFFAPNPGPAHLIECQLTPKRESANANVAESDKSKWKIYPDRKDQWPRLLYHRHFMLSEFYHTLFAPTELENIAEINPTMIEQWREDRRIYEYLQDCIKQNLSSKHPDHNVVLKRIQHELPNPRTVFVDRWKLTDPRLYNELLEGPVKDVASGPQPGQETSQTLTPALTDRETNVEQIVPQRQADGEAKTPDLRREELDKPTMTPIEIPVDSRGAR